jgi:hypothetical protein
MILSSGEIDSSEEPSLDLDAIGIDEIELEDVAEQNEPLEIDLESGETDLLTGSADEVEALASMDIDAELADIDELEDTTEPITEIADAELPDIDLDEDASEEDASEEDEIILDAEPFDEEPFGEVSVSVSAAAELPLGSDAATATETPLPDNLKNELKSVLSYMDQLLESLPEDKIQEFATSDHFTVYRRLFEELGLEQ